MEDWKTKLRQVATEKRTQEQVERKEQFTEDPIDAIIRMTIGSTYQPQGDEIVAQVVRNHRAPYIVRAVKGGLLLYAEPSNNRGILPGDFVAIRETGYTVRKISRVYSK